MNIINVQPLSLYKKKSIINDLFIILSHFYIVFYFLITPLYKFCEIYFSFPNLNLSIIRACILLIVLLLLILKFSIPNSLVNKWLLYKLSPAIFAIIIVWFIFGYSYFTGLNYSSDSYRIYLSRVDSCLVGYTMMFICGIYFDLAKLKVVKRVMIFCWLCFTFFIIFNIKLIVSSFFIYSEKPDITINYIFLSNGYVFFSIFVLAYLKNQSTRILFLIISILIIYFIPSRSNTFGFLSATLIPFLFYGRIKRNILIFLLFLFSVYAMSTILNDNYPFLFESRLLSTRLSDDESLLARTEIANKNLNNFKDTWFFGDFMGDVRIHGEEGSETHSYISFWEQFGVIPFILLLFSVITSVYFLFLMKFTFSQFYLSSLMLMLFIVPLMIFAKGFTNNLIWFLIPRVIVNYYSIKKNTYTYLA